MSKTTVDIKQFADQLALGAAKAIELSDEDWAALARVKADTILWAQEMGRCYDSTLLASATKERSETGDRGDQEQAFAVWYERLVSGAPGDSFWAETCLDGFFHASDDIDNSRVIAALGKVSDLFLQKAIATFPPNEAFRVYQAFRRVLDVALALMVDSYVSALLRGMSQIGLNDRLLKRMRTVAIRKMIDEGRESIPLMTWDDALSVGVETIDTQHKKLIGLLNDLHSAKATGKGDATLKAVLHELLEYTNSHFAFEENLFREHGYPNTSEHEQAHVALKSQVVAFAEDFASGKASLSADLFMFLRNWLNGHIRGSDRRYAPFLQERGVN